jgi:circadian clock protein KaiB
VAETWSFELYIAGETPKAKLAYNNLTEICDEYLPNKYKIVVQDISKHPKLARENQITAIPTIIRKKPAPEKILIGDLTNAERLISKLDLKGYQLKCQGP